MISSHCMSASSGRLQPSCCNSCYKNYGQPLCDSVYDPRHENQKVRCETDLGDRRETDAPVGICEVNATKIDLPPLMWSGYEIPPKSLTIRNTGRTVMINGQWGYGKPYLTGGPLNGTYIFSQIHFHCPSEHHINGIRYPLEMHVVHYKTSYLTQERAMYEKDGTLVLVYLFQVIDHGASQLSHITKAVICVDSENVSIELPKLSLNHLITPFASNYYFYWGSVNTEKNSYLLQWFVHRKIACVTRSEVNNLFKVMDTLKSPVGFTRMKPENGEVFYVEEDESCWQPKSCQIQPCVDKSTQSTCKSQISCRSLCSLKSHSCCEKCQIHPKEESRKQVKITIVDGCTNTTPASSRSEVSKPKTSSKKIEKKSSSDTKSVKESKGKKVSNTAKEEKTKAKKEAKAKEKKAKKDAKECEKLAKMACKSVTSCQSVSKMSSEEMKKKEKAVAEVLCDAVDDIKTLYEKKNSSKKKEKEPKKAGESSKAGKDNEEVQVNFLLTPNNVLSTYSNAANSVDSKSLDVKDSNLTREEFSKSCFNIPTQILIKRNSISDTHLPATNSQNESKEFCLMMEHFFRTDNTKKDDNNGTKDQSWNFQEYHVAIEYDHNILQEYNGMLEPDKLSLGNYEKLNLVPKYDNPKDLHIALTDCSIKLENSDDIRIRAKFLVKENALANGIFSEKRGNGLLNVLDVGTQYAVDEVELASPFKQDNHPSSSSEMEEYIKNELTKLIASEKSSLNKNDLKDELKEDLYRKLYFELRDELEQELREELLNRMDRYTLDGKQNCQDGESKKPYSHSIKRDEELLKMSMESANNHPSDSVSRKNEPEEEMVELKKSVIAKAEAWIDGKAKDFSKKIIPVRIERTNRRNCLRISRKNNPSKNSDGNSVRLSCGSSSNSSGCSKGSRNTTYFVYDRIERDSNTGKKIFIGSFKTKEEIRSLRHCTSSQEQYTSNAFSGENDNAVVQKNETPVDILDVFSKDSDITKIENWCDKQLSQACYGDQKAVSAKSRLDSDRNEIFAVRKSSSADRVSKKPSEAADKRCSAEKNVVPIPRSPKKTEVAVGRSEDKDLAAKTATDDDRSATATTTTTEPGKACRPKSSPPTTSNLDKSADNILTKSTSTELEEFVRKEDLCEKKIKSRTRSASSKSRISTKSGKSKGTVIVIPIEVESLSKIELILVERNNNSLNESTDNEYIPCLNCYKCFRVRSVF